MRDFWDRAARWYDLSQRTNARACQAMVRYTADWVSPGSRVLECAGGAGILSLAAARKAAWVLCTDRSPAMLAQARKHARTLGAGNVSFAQRDIFAPPEPRLFDAVIAGNVLHLLDQPERAVRALAACLRPGGRLILPTFLQGEAAVWFRAALAAYRLAGFRPRHPYTAKSYENMLAGCGVGGIVYQKTLPGPLPVGFAVIVKQEVPL